jgi:2-methylcitrate dehydratase PrpD
MMKKVKTYLHPGIESKGYDKILSIVDVKLKHGKTLTKESGPYRGSPQNPLAQGELSQKFRECAELVLDDDKIGEVLNLINCIEELATVKELIQVLVSG